MQKKKWLCSFFHRDKVTQRQQETLISFKKKKIMVICAKDFRDKVIQRQQETLIEEKSGYVGQRLYCDTAASSTVIK